MIEPIELIELLEVIELLSITSIKLRGLLMHTHLHIYTCVWHSADRMCKRVLWIPPSNYKIWWWYWAGATSINTEAMTTLSYWADANQNRSDMQWWWSAIPCMTECNRMIYNSRPLSSDSPPQKIWLFNSHQQIVSISNESHRACSALLSTSWLYFRNTSLPPKPGLRVRDWNKW